MISGDGWIKKQQRTGYKCCGARLVATFFFVPPLYNSGSEVRQ